MVRGQPHPQVSRAEECDAADGDGQMQAGLSTREEESSPPSENFITGIDCLFKN